MKRIILIAALLVAGIAVADTFERKLTSSAKVRRSEITPLADGGCSIVVFGTYEVDAGPVLGSRIEGARTDDKDLSGAARTDCVNLLARSLTHFQNEKVP